VILNLAGDKHATFAFYAGRSSISREVYFNSLDSNIQIFVFSLSQILDLATGNHELYIKRRQEQSIEIQQMRYFEEQQQKVCSIALSDIEKVEHFSYVLIR
jgi:hypothetical protein